MELDWNAHHNAEMVKAVIGKDMSMEEFWHSGDTQFRDRIAPYLPGNTEVKTALEIGCGPGRLVRPLAGVFGQVIGVDISSDVLKVAKKELADLPNVSLVKSGGADLWGVESNSVDFLMSFDVFQHMPTQKVQEAYLNEARRVLKPGGSFLIQFKTTKGWMRIAGIPVLPRAVRPLIPGSLMQLYRRMKGMRPERTKSTWHGNLIRHSRVKPIFGKHGLKVERLVYDGGEVRWIAVGRTT
ncbi:hypothetical protein BSL82_00560 [Tardibacter chloracetimidivorans]|uniref:Methyltransferase type 11 domain-containing protein n=1 Tax=Tardibacter chloracetimidivorans TaxID=1921510 RepID=A0A1L3ZQU5_9SPHN|nr:class I SAM-dependent methyltransferase [Tardibacter chloracetimidivorans]API57980.1 hypothetical protein BSL82_00560 [Tardibacter chloracetimidivorans]